jgi:plastocyanin
VIVVSAGSEIFSYAAVLDNNTADPIFVVGAEDQPPQPITPVATVGGPTTTPTPPGPTPTPTPPSGGVRTVEVGPNNDMIFVDQVSGNSTTTITAGTTVHWVWVDSDLHSTTSDTGIWDSGEHGEDHTFDRQFNDTGSFAYHCTVHGFSMSGTVVVNP